jgi:hypothetical protein
VDFSACVWFDANMSAPLGVVFAHARRQPQHAQASAGFGRVSKPSSAKNHFLAGFGFPGAADTHGTTIPYRRFSATDDRYFRGLPEPDICAARACLIMSEALSAALQEQHPGALRQCGECTLTANSASSPAASFFPQRNRLDFCVADAGLGSSPQDLQGASA